MDNEESSSNDLSLSYYVIRARQMMDTYEVYCFRFYIWLNKFEFVADIIKVPKNMMFELFRHMVDEDTYAHVQSCFPCINYSQLSYEGIIKLFHKLFDYFDDERETYRERFRSREQFEQELILKYAANLEKLYSRCEFITRKNARICDRFISGLRDEEIRGKLEQLLECPFIRVVHIALEMTITKNMLRR